uniref:Uncharacterized protein n=1 Tax=Physcomitrium patens TaxID=3218 RepID=A0A2K1K8B3_PHYPA|nr:hypothetical protein PHYPA_011913 [Physcomitrium patens]
MMHSQHRTVPFSTDSAISTSDRDMASKVNTFTNLVDILVNNKEFKSLDLVYKKLMQKRCQLDNFAYNILIYYFGHSG